MNAPNSEAIMEAHYHPAELVKLRSNDGPKRAASGRPSYAKPVTSSPQASHSYTGRKVITPLAPSAGNSVLRFGLDWSASVGQVAPRLLAYGATYFLRKCGQCLTGGSAATFKGTVIGVE